MENRIVVDWLTFTSKIDSLESIIELLGLSSCPFDERPKGRNGYRRMMQFQNISILYDGQESMGICVDISGKGCRECENYSSHGADFWNVILGTICFLEPDSYNLTRLDVAYDDFSGILNIDTLQDDTDEHLYRSRSRTWEVVYGSQGTSIYHGSKKSDMLIRIYDKAAEQHTEGQHWIRVELQMRNVIALGFASQLVDSCIGDIFSGVLRNYLCYVVPSPDSNMSRWPLAPYWAALLSAAERISVWSCPGTSFDAFKLQHYIVNQCGNALDAYISIFGVEDLVAQLGKRAIRRSPKYELLKQQYEDLKKQK